MDRLVVRRERQEFRVGMVGPHGVEKLEGQLVTEGQVHDGHVGIVRLDEPKGFLEGSRIGSDDHVYCLFGAVANDLADGGVIVNDHHTCVDGRAVDGGAGTRSREPVLANF